MCAKITKTKAKTKDFAKGSVKITKNTQRLPKPLMSTVFLVNVPDWWGLPRYWF